MWNVFKAELTKLKRPSLSISTIAAVTFVTGLVTSLLFLLVDSPEGNGWLCRLDYHLALVMPQAYWASLHFVSLLRKRRRSTPTAHSEISGCVNLRE